MPRIIEDPTQAVCPSFEDAGWDFLRQSMIDAHQGAVPLTPEEATQTLKNAWDRENGAKLTAWNAQVEQDRADQVEQDRLAQEEADAQLALHQKEAEDQLREAEKKKPKLNDFDPDRVISDWIEPRPAPYAVNRLNNLEYVELDYFTTKGCIEAGADTEGSANLDTSPSPNSMAPYRWEEMLQGKNVMLRFMAKSTTWPQAHAQSLAAFFVALELHQDRADKRQACPPPLSKPSQARVVHSPQAQQGFNIEHIGKASSALPRTRSTDRPREKSSNRYEPSHLALLYTR
ncbi:hypothetical protein EDB85DRAFT_2147683 [Lactarius pseudohatsudake]|nr:hypothetical protein EDB85DRAFT_2147683 [Lactarius pseudohatsudake]